MNVLLIKKIKNFFEMKFKLLVLRRKAKALHEKVVQRKGFKMVDKKKIRFLKSYSRNNFGSSSYWPYLALYTEIRGKFIPGWLPNDYYAVIMLDKVNPVLLRHISDLKTFDYMIFPDFSLKPIVIKISGYYYDSQRRRLEEDEAKKILYDYNKEVIVKEDFGRGGGQVKFIQSKDLELSQLDNNKNYIVQPVVNQHKELKRLNDKSVNSLRIITYLTDNGEVEVKFAGLRFGIGNIRVDNLSSGGGVCEIMPNGFLKDEAYDDLGLSIGKKHPESKVAFNEIQIPNYDELLNTCKKSHAIFSYVKLIGWDVAINSKSEPVLLEWNTRPLMWIPEAISGPMWENEFNKISN